jgi:hypothetical protein
MKHFPPAFWWIQGGLFLITVALNSYPVVKIAPIVTVASYTLGSILWARAAYHWGKIHAYREMQNNPTFLELRRLNKELEAWSRMKENKNSSEPFIQ